MSSELYSSIEWKEKWKKAQIKVDSIAEDLELKRAENDKDTIELDSQRLENAITYRDDCKNNYFVAKSEEESGKYKVQVGLTSIGSTCYGF